MHTDLAPGKDQMTATAFNNEWRGTSAFSWLLGVGRSMTADQLRRALLSRWDYADSRPSLRWDSLTEAARTTCGRSVNGPDQDDARGEPSGC